MKVIFNMLILFAASHVMAQTDVLQSGVYRPGTTTIQHTGDLERKEVLSGKTLDLKTYHIYTLSLPAGKNYIPPAADSRFEQLIVIQSGRVKLMLKDSVKVVGPGSLALILAGDNIRFQNTSNEPVSWYVINYESVNPVNIRRGQEAGPSFIKDWEQLRVNKTAKGESRLIFDRATSMFERFEVHATALNPGYASHDPHTHRVEELILMLKGSVQEHIGQNEYMANAGDCIFLASGILHGPKNISSQQCYYLAIQWHNLKTD